MAYKCPQRVMKKKMLVLLICVLSVKCVAQDVQSYIGNSKVYMLPNWGDVYAAQTYDWTGDGFYNTYYFSSIKFLDNGNVSSYSSSHGKYIAFQYFYRVTTGRYASCEQVIFGNTTGKGSGYYAFVITGNKLHLVDVKTDVIISTFDNNFQKGKDFSIVVYDPSSVNDGAAPNFWVINNGYVKIYYGFPAPSSISTMSVDVDNSGKIYNVGGVEVKKPENGVYIKKRRKYLAK